MARIPGEEIARIWRETDLVALVSSRGVPFEVLFPGMHTPEEHTAMINRLKCNALSYEFEVYGDAYLSWPLLYSGATPQAVPTTSWTVPWELPENTWIWWRARVVDGQSASAWTEAASFFVNAVNDPPGVCWVSEPQESAEVSSTAPTLGVSNSADPDGDLVSYAFLVCADEQMTQPVASVAGLPAGTAGTAGITFWVVAPAPERQHAVLLARPGQRRPGRQPVGNGLVLHQHGQ